MKRQYNRKDHFYHKAKSEGFRSRAAYKLDELQSKHKIIKPNANVLDLGCFPGGWLQIAAGAVKRNGLVIGIDLKPLEAFSESESEVIKVIECDLYHEDLALSAIRKYCEEKFDVIISDMSPSLSGIKEKDQAESVELFFLALKYCDLLLKENGNFISKVFPSQDMEFAFKEQKKNWGSFKKTTLKSTRTSSNELYVIGKAFNTKI